MIQLIIAAWSASVVLIFLPVGPVARLIWRRLRPADSPAPEPAETLPGSAVPPVGLATAAPEQAAAALLKLEAPVAVAEPPDAAASGQEPPGPTPAADEEAPAAPSFAPRNRALVLFGWLATLALYVLFVGSSIYLAPRLLERVLDNEHPMAAITSQSMYPALKRGDLVLLEGIDEAAELEVGDILAFESDDGFAIHRIVGIDGETITTKGDANLIEDEPISFEQVIGRALTIRGRLAKIPYLGNIPLIFKQTAEEEAGGGALVLD